MRLQACALLVPVFLLTACQADAPPAEVSASVPVASTTIATAAPSEAAAQAPAAAPSAASAEPEVARGFRKDMPYSELRKRLLDAGWLPLRDADCQSNVGGEADVCNYLPETTGCSGDGHCTLRFGHAGSGQIARIGTYGPNDPGNTLGEGKALTVRYWEFSAVDPVAAPSCPSQDFQAFLQHYASDPAAAKRLNAPLVKTVELRSDGEGDFPQPVYMTASAYDGFNVRFQGGAFHHVDSEGAVDPDPLRLDISAQGADQRLVAYQYGMSEGNSYRFERHAGCWRLAEDPEPPAP